MKKHLEDALNGEVPALFTEKACHVFADELIGNQPAKGWIFYRLATKLIAALHVCVGKNGCFVDVRGKHTEEELLSAWREQWGPQLEGIYPCTRDDLFENPQFDVQTSEVDPLPDFLRNPEVGRAFEQQSKDKNKWGLVIDPEFLARAREKARAAIQHDPAKYDLESLC
jgi:hypothetical protein